MAFKLRSKFLERANHGKRLGKDILCRGDSKGDSLEAKKSLACLRNRKEALWLGHSE